MRGRSVGKSTAGGGLERPVGRGWVGSAERLRGGRLGPGITVLLHFRDSALNSAGQMRLCGARGFTPHRTPSTPSAHSCCAVPAHAHLGGQLAARLEGAAGRGRHEIEREEFEPLQLQGRGTASVGWMGSACVNDGARACARNA